MSNIGVVEKLQNFQYKDAKSKDWGLNVRNRAKELANFVLNPDRVRSERAKVQFCTQSFCCCHASPPDCITWHCFMSQPGRSIISYLTRV